MLAPGDVVEQVSALWFEPFGEGEEGVAFAHVDGAELAGPVVDVAEEVAVDGLEVGEVVAAEVEPVVEEDAFPAGGEAGFGSPSSL